MLNTYRYKGGEVVKAGFYWNLAEWEAKIVPAEGAPLAGTADTRYLRVPLLAVLVLAPIMGLTYAMFLPFIGFAMVAMYLTGWLKRLVTPTPPAKDEAAHQKKAA
jgi:hypothetical protein